MSACVSPFHFDSFSRTTVRAGMLMPRARVSVAKTALHSPRTNSCSTHCLNAGSMPGVVGRDAAGQPVEEVVVAEDVHGPRRAGRRTPPRRTRGSRRAPPGVVSRIPERRHCCDGRVAADPAEDEHDRGQQPGARRAGRGRRRGSGSRPGGRCRPGGRRPPALRAVALRAYGGRACRVLAQSSRAIRSSSALTGAPSLTKPGGGVDVGGGEQVHHPLADQHVLVERHRPPLLDDRVGVAAHGLQPLAELLGVGDGRGQRDQGHRLGEVDDHLLPDRAAGAVGEVVDLVHHDVPEARRACRSRRTACCGAPRWSSPRPAPRR